MAVGSVSRLSQKVLQIRRFLPYFGFVESSKSPILIEARREELRRLGVQALYLFGSRAMGYEHARSDYDYAVLLKEEGHKRGDALYDKLYDLLSPISPRTLENDVLDIVFLRDAGLELRFHVIRHGRVLFESDPSARMNFEARTTLLYCDYRPVLDEFDRNLLESL